MLLFFRNKHEVLEVSGQDICNLFSNRLGQELRKCLGTRVSAHVCTRKYVMRRIIKYMWSDVQLGNLGVGYEISCYYFCNFSVNVKLLQCLKRIIPHPARRTQNKGKPG